MSQREQYIDRTPKAGVCQPLASPPFSNVFSTNAKSFKSCKQKVKHFVFWRSEWLFILANWWRKFKHVLGCRWPLRLNFFFCGELKRKPCRAERTARAISQLYEAAPLDRAGLISSGSNLSYKMIHSRKLMNTTMERASVDSLGRRLGCIITAMNSN